MQNVILASKKRIIFKKGFKFCTNNNVKILKIKTKTAILVAPQKHFICNGLEQFESSDGGAVIPRSPVQITYGARTELDRTGSLVRAPLISLSETKVLDRNSYSKEAIFFLPLVFLNISKYYLNYSNPLPKKRTVKFLSSLGWIWKCNHDFINERPINIMLYENVCPDIEFRIVFPSNTLVKMQMFFSVSFQPCWSWCTSTGPT